MTGLDRNLDSARQLTASRPWPRGRALVVASLLALAIACYAYYVFVAGDRLPA
jgi:hypothetical protein